MEKEISLNSAGDMVESDIKVALRTYAEIKSKIKALEEEAAELNPTIFEWIEESGNKEQPTSLGNFTIKSKRIYEYPQEIKQLESDLKEKKKECEALGTASFKETKYLEFKAKKGTEDKDTIG